MKNESFDLQYLSNNNNINNKHKFYDIEQKITTNIRSNERI